MLRRGEAYFVLSHPPCNWVRVCFLSFYCVLRVKSPPIHSREGEGEQKVLAESGTILGPSIFQIFFGAIEDDVFPLLTLVARCMASNQVVAD